jgi:hypothetical protein
LDDSRTPTGAASGDLGGTYPAPEVIKLRGYSVSLTSPSDNQAIIFNSTATAFQNSTLTVGTISGLTAELAKKVEKESTDSTPINVLRALTQAEYDSIVTKDPFTIYFIKQ